MVLREINKLRLLLFRPQLGDLISPNPGNLYGISKFHQGGEGDLLMKKK